MASYVGRHAALYDLFYAEKAYGDEAAFVDRLFCQHGACPQAKLLELACGTGRHALELAARDYEIVATDYSPDMLAVAGQRLAQAADNLRTRVRFAQADMRRLEESAAVASQIFDGAYALFDSIGYVQTNEAVIETFAGVKRGLRAGSIFIFEFWHAAAMLRGYDPLRVRRWLAADGEVLRISRTTVDALRQLCHVGYEILELDRDGRYHRIEETQTNRFFLVQEMAALAAAGGMTPLAWHDGFSEGAVTENTWHVVGVARA